jgi:hypothetical protein
MEEKGNWEGRMLEETRSLKRKEPKRRRILEERGRLEEEECWEIKAERRRMMEGKKNAGNIAEIGRMLEDELCQI